MPTFNRPSSAAVQALSSNLPSWVPDWLRPSGNTPDTTDISGLMGPIEAPAAAGIALASSSPAKALASRLIKSGGNAIKGTSLEEAIQYLSGAMPKSSGFQDLPGLARRTLSHVSEIIPEQMTNWTKYLQGAERPTLGEMVPHAGGPYNNGQVANIFIDPLMTHADPSDAINVLSHETNHVGQVLRQYDMLKGANVPADQWPSIVNAGHEYGSQHPGMGYFNMPMEREARITGNKKSFQYLRDVAGEPDFAGPTQDLTDAAVNVATDPQKEYPNMQEAIMRAMANAGRKGVY